jgi:hypothetical protein
MKSTTSVAAGRGQKEFILSTPPPVASRVPNDKERYANLYSLRGLFHLVKISGEILPGLLPASDGAEALRAL